ncbi:MAG: cyclic nucleotide-binding domain-containing protein [Deltaproteobacteria bacterium]|nr:cyclic nucleotide-binding domain-containing protein [Deltaproteobacteria bacterium]
MATVEELKKIVILSYLTDEMLEKLCAIVQTTSHAEGDTIFTEGAPADRIYLLKGGKILLEQTISDTITASLGSVKPGYSFGWSAMLNQESYTSGAVCAESCEVYAINAQSLKNLCDQDYKMGYLFYQRLLRVIKKRHDRRTEQFVRVISDHPDIKGLLEDV